jgi:hypothetical protein
MEALERPGKLTRITPPKTLSRARIMLALAIAVSADVTQFLLGPFGWAFADQAIDVAAMLLTMWLLGFHVLLLPTLVIEFIPVADMLPTWTACVVGVIALRKRQERMLATESGPVVDIK